MSTEGLEPVLVDQYGGLVTLIDRSDLPVGVSPDCQNVEFFPGGVRSRSGFTSYVATGDEVNGMLPYTNTANVTSLLISTWGSTDAGAVKIISPFSSATVSDVPLGTGLAHTKYLGPGVNITGTTIFGKSFFTLYYPANPVSVNVVAPAGPFFYDGTAIYPASQEGPCASFTVTPAAGGSIEAGRHDFCILYETSSGYVTPMSDVVGSGAFTLANGKADFATIPIGPGAVVKRIIFATPKGSSSFFTLPRFTINDNTTTTLTGLTFTDAELMSGTSLEDYIDRIVIPPMQGVAKYGRRLVYWGGLSKVQPFLDLDKTTNTPRLIGLQSLAFDGRAATLPYPWVTTAGAAGLGGAVVGTEGTALQAYQITGDGVSAVRGEISQAVPNIGASNTYFLVPGRRYGIRIRWKRGGAILQGKVTLNLYGYDGITDTLLTTLSSNVNGGPDYWFTDNSSTVVAPVAATHTTVKLYLSATNTLSNGASIFIDWISIYDVTDNSSPSLLYITPPDDPETVNPTNGIVAVSENDGQPITSVFELRGNLYISKANSLYVTTDNGDDPIGWTVDQVSGTVGSPSVKGISVGDGWAVIAAQDGCYQFSGGVPEKLSQEIQPTWDLLRWDYGYAVFTAIDEAAKKVYVGAYTPSQYACYELFVLDFVEGLGDPISGGGSGRKWTKWTFGDIPVTSMSVFKPTASSQYTLLGLRLLASPWFRISAYAKAAVTDTDGGIASYYETAPIGTEIGRSLFDRLIMRIRGSGSLVTQSRTPGGTLTTLTTKTLAAAPDDDIEIKFRGVQTQLGFRIGTTGATDYWSLRRLGAFLKQSPFSYLRKT